MDARARVFNHHDPYDLKGTEEAFVAAMRENALFQQAGCADYARILREQDFDPASIRSMRDLERLPFLPTLYFKRHKLSFAYATVDATMEDLRALARHICQTGQVLCTSCQGLYVDTDRFSVVERMAEELFTALREAARELPPVDPGLRGQATLRLYNEQLEAARTGRQVLRGGGVSVLLCPDRELELSFLHGNCWVKGLPRAQLIETLRGKKEYLQTAGLLCAPADRPVLTELLCRAGVVRVTEPGLMSRTVAGEAHDGTFPLREYTRVAEGLW